MASYDIFTQRERELMTGVWHAVNIDQAHPDYIKLMGLANINAEKTAKNRWGDGKKKVKEALKNSKVAEFGEFTELEQVIMCVAWQCLKDKISVDYDKIVEKGITKTTKTAKNRWGDINKKVKTAGGTLNGPADAPSTPGSSAAPKTKKSTSTKRKANGEDANDTPTKRTKRAAPAKLCVKDEDAATSKAPIEEEEDDAVLALAAEEQVLREALA